jgi:hypothetical protein
MGIVATFHFQFGIKGFPIIITECSGNVHSRKLKVLIQQNSIISKNSSISSWKKKRNREDIKWLSDGESEESFN